MQAQDTRGRGGTKVHVLVTSLDGNLRHPFERDATIGEVHDEAYRHLVKQKNQIPQDRTWIEYNNQRLEPTVILSSLVAEPGRGPEPDITLALSWDTAGGC